MKKYLYTIILSLLISSVAMARSTGCKEGNCENGFGKWEKILSKDQIKKIEKNFEKEMKELNYL
mgnify:CR=1 FL=1